MNTIAVDCGASFVKAALFDGTNLVKTIQRESPSVHQAESVFEIEQINKLVSLVKEIFCELIVGLKNVRLCISNEMHGFLLTDCEGVPITDYISWQKEYGSVKINGKSSVEIILEDSDLKNCVKQSGMPVRAGLPSANLLHLKRSGLLDGIKGTVHFYTLGSYLLREISKKEPYEHPTNAAATGLFDIHGGDWNREFIHRLGLENLVFSPVCEETVSFNFNGCNVCTYPAIGDQQAALLGAGLSDQGELSFNLGTGAQVSICVQDPVFGDGYQIRPYFYGRYLKTIPHIPSGRALNVYFRFIRSILTQYKVNCDDGTIWEGITTCLAKNKKSSIHVDMSFFENAVTDHTVGNISSIGEWDFSMENMVTAVFNQLVANYIQIADRICPDHNSINTVIFSGGIARRFEFIRQKIVAEFPHAAVYVADDETLIGLNKYSYMLQETGECS